MSLLSLCVCVCVSLSLLWRARWLALNDWTASAPQVNNATFAKYLHDAGYTVGIFGKYLNTVPHYVSEGFDAWMVNGGGR